MTMFYAYGAGALPTLGRTNIAILCPNDAMDKVQAYILLRYECLVLLSKSFGVWMLLRVELPRK